MKKSLILLLALLMLSGCGNSAGTTPNTDSSAPSSNQTDDTQSNDSAASESSDDSAETFQLTFTAKDLDGNEVDQSVFANAKLTMMNIWATFCGPCINEMPELGELAAEGGTDYQIIGVCADLNGTEDMLEDAKEIVSQTKANYLHLQPAEDLYPVLTASSSVPVTFFFDSEGKLVGKGILGAQDKDTWSQVISERLEIVKADETTSAEDSTNDAA
ncbi:MAG: TlpA family protein disulfide reductase [Butyricicoccus pullicaecorum]|nr:TlpA family protein disulfide reductase [Butyricicoccus pullicaecorum]